MSVTVWIPPFLRRLAGGHDELPLSGGDVGEVLGSLERAAAGILDRVLEGGELREEIRLFVNGHEVAARSGLATPLAPGDELSIIPAVRGGR
jgi:sulfur-carrier protein